MSYEPEQHHRRSIRLPGYDYSVPGWYFVTICTFGKKCFFGDIVDDQMRLNLCGQIVHDEWFRSAKIRPELGLDAFIVMPNHIHGIVRITVGAHGVRPIANQLRAGAHAVCPYVTGTQSPRRVPLRRPRSLASFVAGLKARTTSRIRRNSDDAGLTVWQRNYYEHIIRNEEEADRIQEYICTNPLRWDSDPENPAAPGHGEDEHLWDL